jgi:hypothetical protein
METLINDLVGIIFINEDWNSYNDEMISHEELKIFTENEILKGVY